MLLLLEAIVFLTTIGSVYKQRDTTSHELIYNENISLLFVPIRTPEIETKFLRLKYWGLS